MSASLPASMMNQIPALLGIPFAAYLIE
jgi:hypothetical protein